MSENVIAQRQRERQPRPGRVRRDAPPAGYFSHPRGLRKVPVPSPAPAFVTSGMFAFLASMDNYPISIFFTDAWTKTLPIQMLQYVEESPDPTIAAISIGLILLAVLALSVAGRLIGLRRLAEF
jgi:putative spermidine/putrescine transport system permease protein